MIKELEQWYQSQCDGKWEHRFGIRIGTLDNPGLNVTINLEDTELEDKALDKFKENYEHDTEWMICEKKDNCFIGRSGPNRLEDILAFFIDWKNS